MAPCFTIVYISNELERVQKWALGIILPDSSYGEALAHLGCLRLYERREQLCLNTLKRIEKGGPLSKYVPMTRGNTNDYELRNSDTLTIKCRTERYRRSFFPSTVAVLNNNTLITTLY